MTLTEDIKELPLKKPQETFVDEPERLEDVNLNELIFDIKSDLKDVNNIHIFQALAILYKTLDDILRLQKDPRLFEKFRSQQLQKYDIDTNDVSSVHIEESERDFGVYESGTNTVNDDNDGSDVSNFSTFKSSDLLSSVESKIDSESGDYDMIGETKYPCSTDLAGIQPLTEAPYIPIDYLVANFSPKVCETIASHSKETIHQEILFSQRIKANQNSHLLKIFNLLKAPDLSIRDFLIRIETFSTMSVLVCIHSAYLLFKLCLLLDVVKLSPLNIHRLVLGLIRCLTKTLEDLYQKQGSFAAVGGISKKDLFRIEVSFLYLTNFRLTADEEILDQFLKQHFVELREFCEESFEKS
ncbi:uncharacterized protein PRCAT00000304001 [Priceomyces carsonii]|uniref:uncharacterized protein n=1 Tax=Priceomyces carsonii TaxID=28549 RepID=UPI002ED9BEA2|nr:unnamed protein product [Priceomyces carsonii]